MSKFESVLLSILKVALVAGETAGPIFFHSKQGIAILNAGETFAGEVIQLAAVTASTPTA